MAADVNSVLRAYLVTQASLTALIGGATPRLYCPRLPENCVLPAIGFFARGGKTNQFTRWNKDISFQFDCWACNPTDPPKAAIEARSIYIALYNILQGIGGYYGVSIPVVVGANTYYILEAQEETGGQDLQDVDIPNYFRCLSFWKVKIQVA